MLRNFWSNLEIIEFVLRNLTCVRAHNEMDFVRDTIDLCEQPLQIDGSAGAGGGDHEFHSCLTNHNSSGCSSQMRAWPYFLLQVQRPPLCVVFDNVRHTSTSKAESDP